MNLSNDDWSRALALFEQLLDVPEPARADWIATLPAESAHLAPVLQQMLRERPALEDAGFLQGTPEPPDLPDLPDLADPPTQSLRAHSRVGPYRLLRPLGEGGMAGVWLAERADGAHRRPVALKLPLAGRSGQHRRITAGFLQECHVLSRLTHPNIASVLDAGTDARQPWLAMEYIDGQSITRHCHDKALDVSARLRLFLQVLRAVQHAHAHLVIHRDIKPGNVIVDAGGHVKLLDFGIAKLLSPSEATGDADATKVDAQTLWGGHAMTPEYASPEQIVGNDIGTASDVFALGLMLFELLLGRRLYRRDESSPGALEQAILHTEAPRPSDVARTDPQAQLPGITPKRLASRLSGDLDLIVAKALRKSPQERYETAAAFAEDIERHLEHRPILARPDSIVHQLRRFAARHRVAVGAYAVVAVTLVVGVSITLWQARLAHLEGQRAKAAMGFLTGLFENSARLGSGARPAYEVTGKELLEAGVKRLGTDYAEATPLRLELLQLLGKVSEEMDLQQLSTPLIEESVSLSKSLFGDKDPRYAEALLTRADTMARHGLYEKAIPAGEAALAALQRLRPVPAESVAQAHIVLGNVMDQIRRYDESRDHLQTALRLLQDSGSTSENRSRAPFYLARYFEGRGELAKAEAQYLDGLAAARKNFGARSYIVAFGEENYGDLLRQMARFDDAQQHLQQAIDTYVAVLGPKHLNVASAHYYLAHVMAAKGQRVQADALYVQAIALSDEVAGPFHRVFGGYFMLDRAQLLLDMGLLAQARVIYEAWLQHWPAGSDERARLIRYVGLGYSRVLVAQREPVAAQAILAAVDASLNGKSPGARAPSQRYQWLARRAGALLAGGDVAAARAMLEPALKAPFQAPEGDFGGAVDLLGTLTQTQPPPAIAQAALQSLAALGDLLPWASANVERQALLAHTRGRLTLLAGQATDARPMLARAVALRERIDAPDSPWLAQARLSLAECDAALRRTGATATTGTPVSNTTSTASAR